jgi:TonB family protein
MKLCTIIAFFTLAGTGVFSLPSEAQDEVTRKTKKESKPEYPTLARTMHITGVARIEVTINPDGKVKNTRVIGGHPLLVRAAEQAAKLWEFEAGSKPTTQVLEFKFGNQDN